MKKIVIKDKTVMVDHFDEEYQIISIDDGIYVIDDSMFEGIHDLCPNKTFDDAINDVEFVLGMIHHCKSWLNIRNSIICEEVVKLVNLVKDKPNQAEYQTKNIKLKYGPNNQKLILNNGAELDEPEKQQMFLLLKKIYPPFKKGSRKLSSLFYDYDFMLKNIKKIDPVGFALNFKLDDEQFLDFCAKTQIYNMSNFCKK